MKEYSGVAREMGIKPREIDTIQAIVVAVSGGRVRAQFRAARRLKPAGPSGKRTDGTRTDGERPRVEQPGGERRRRT